MADFPIPSFLQNQSVEEIHKSMLQQLPENIDKSEGGHPWNLTRPHAYEAAYMAEFVLVEAIKLIFPKYAEDYADTMMDHAEMRGIERKAATYATGEITITGKAGTVIPAGSAFSTASVNGEPAVEFVTTEEVTIGSDETVTVAITAVEAGTVGNVPAGTIILKANAVSGITAVTNEEDTSGGTEEESIESLQQRIIEYDLSQSISYVGSEADYRRWAMEVPGVGNAVIIPAQDSSGLIQIIITDANGDPANEELCEDVYNHIMRPDAPAERLAPINGGNIEVVAPATVAITITAIVELEEGASIITVREKFLEALNLYMVEASQDSEVKYSRVYAILSGISGVEDHKNLLVNGGTANIAISNQQLPAIAADNLEITVGTV